MEGEVLYQEQDSEGLFDDFDSSETPNEVEEEPKAETTDTPFLSIKYNGEGVDLTQEKAIELSQKGMNYDKMYDKYNSLNTTLADLARRNNMSVDDFLNNLVDVQRETEMMSEMDMLRSDPKYAGTSDDVLKELASSRIADRFTQSESRARQQEEQRADALKTEADRQIDVFTREYPDVDLNSLGDEVLNYVKEGYTLTEAYTKWARMEATKNAPVSKANAKNEENRKRSLGSTTNVDNVDADDFLSGFLKG